MATYTAVVSWERGNQAFVDRQYSTAERIAGVSMEAWTFRRHPPPHVVPLPLSNAAAVDPEEAFVASASSMRFRSLTSVIVSMIWVRPSAVTALDHCTNTY